jgi:hypothetical protein
MDPDPVQTRPDPKHWWAGIFFFFFSIFFRNHVINSYFSVIPYKAMDSGGHAKTKKETLCPVKNRLKLSVLYQEGAQQ